MPNSRADVTTQHASRYLQQLCKHWAHKFSVEFDPHRGTIEMPAARIALEARNDRLLVDVNAEDAAALERMEGVVAEHIVRFAFREDLVFDWTREG
ncbi:DUF2218 domain-containing protein [Aureimonas flava]|uniref:DUF2218 domain-containing protein n=1 Tax=Aureimonas flava TaxID=2320271 RepID=A0A3A1WRN7_9HYPH|nr:DUF2218 domain-containing protein [Aureimonas flava]RIY03345.1 DUF2218 domain-containing protein [Aureimonas flava]